MTRSLQAKALIVAVFVVGALTGVALTDLYESRLASTRSSPDEDPASVERPRRPPIERFEDFLKMTQEQRDQLAEILRRSAERNRELQAQTRPMYQALREMARDEIRGILTDEQRGRYEEWLVRLEENRNRGRGDRPRDEAR